MNKCNKYLMISQISKMLFTQDKQEILSTYIFIGNVESFYMQIYFLIIFSLDLYQKLSL